MWLTGDAAKYRLLCHVETNQLAMMIKFEVEVFIREEEGIGVGQ